jgi:hypothetical protein
MMIPGIKEERRMRKISVIGASLLLLALGSCSREKETTPADGFVKMRFTAVVGETRTAYENDKTASWVAGDAISVYVTNGTDGQVVNFTAGEDLTFEGNVPAGYTTIVAGAYPADAAHTFDATGVKTLHFPTSYTLAAGANPASILPLAGTYANGVMTFRHPAGALKFTVDNVPAAAVRFRFTAAGQKVNGSFAMDPALAVSEVEAEQSVDITVPAAEGSRSFYVPMPAGELAAGAAIALYDAENNLLFQKTVPQALTVSKNVIKRIAAVETWKKNEAWSAYYYGSYATTSGTIGKRICVENVTGTVYYEVLTEAVFNELGGSAAAYLSSSHFEERLAGMTKVFDGAFNINYTTLNKGKRYVMVFSADLDTKTFTGEYNCIEVNVPTFSTPAGWSIFVTERETDFTVKYTVPSTGIQWQYVSLPAADFENTYLNDLECAIYTIIRSRKKSHESNPDSWKPRTGTQTYVYPNSGEYVLISVGIDENYRPTGAYCRLDYNFAKEDPSEAYGKWLGKWSVNDGTNSDTWTISRRRANHTYTVTGICGRSYPVEALFNEDGSLLFKSQKNVANVISSGDERVISFYRATADKYSAANAEDLMTVTFSESDTDSATASYCTETYQYYQFIGVNAQNKAFNYTKRPLPATLTRVVSDGVMLPDGGTDNSEEALPAE